MHSEISLSPDIRLPLDFATARASLVGISGAGKSNALTVMIEQCWFAGIPFTHIDPLGAAYGIRSSADGNGPGIAVPIFGGYHGDLPLRSDAGSLIARELYELDASAVLDLSAFDSDEQAHFVTDLCTAMMRLHQQKKKVRSLFVDEAAMLAPERKNSTHEHKCAVAIARVHTGGRGLGIGLKTATQSSAEQDKRTMKQSEIFVALRTASPLDQAPILAYVRTSVEKAEAEKIKNTLAHLADGEAWFIAPRWIGVKRARFALRTTFDSSRTPKLGESIQAPRQLAPVDLARLRAALAADADDVPVESSDVVRVVERKIVEYVEVQAISAEMLEAFRSAVTILSEATQPLIAALERVGSLQPIASTEQPTDAGAPKVQAISPRGELKIAKTLKPKGEIIATKPLGAERLPPSAQVMLDTFILRFPMRLTPRQLATMSGRSFTSSAFMPNLRDLIKHGYIEKRNSHYALTALTVSELKLKDSKRKPHDVWIHALPPSSGRMLRSLLDAYPSAISRHELALRSSLSPTSSGVGTALRELRDNDLIQENGSSVAASAWIAK